MRGDSIPNVSAIFCTAYEMIYCGFILQLNVVKAFGLKFEVGWFLKGAACLFLRVFCLLLLLA